MRVQVTKSTGRSRSNICCTVLRGLLSPKLFKALGDPRRVSLLVRLAEQHGPCTVGLVAQGSGVDLSVVSRHLAILRGAGIIDCQKRGKEVWCAVQTGTIAKMLRDLADALDVCCPSGTCTTVSEDGPQTKQASIRKEKSTR